jgi:hypothetical protein
VARTARWLAEHPPPPGSTEETVLTDPFDYAAEDRLVDAWYAARDRIGAVHDWFRDRPGFGLAYSGPGGRPRRHADFTP